MKKALFGNISRIKYYFSRKTLIPSPAPTDANTSECSKLKTEADLVKKYSAKLNTEIEIIKMIKTDQFCPLKNSDSEQNGCVSTENRKVIEPP